MPLARLANEPCAFRTCRRNDVGLRVRSKMADRTRSSTRVSAKGQVVIPKAIRDASGWHTGLELVVEVTEDGVILRPKTLTRARAAEELLGCTEYQGPRRSLAEMDAAVAREAK